MPPAEGWKLPSCDAPLCPAQEGTGTPHAARASLGNNCVLEAAAWTEWEPHPVRTHALLLYIMVRGSRIPSQASSIRFFILSSSNKHLLDLAFSVPTVA